MTDRLNDYFIAFKRGSRDSAPSNWVEIVSGVQDVKVVNATDFKARIRATPLAAEQLRQLFKDSLMIEEIIERKNL